MKDSVLDLAPEDILAERQVEEEVDFFPLHNYVLVDRIEKGADFEGRIMLPATSQIVRNAAKHARVVAVGTGHVMDNGTVVPLRVAPGDLVYYAALAGADIRLGGKTYYVTREEEIMGIIRPRAKKDGRVN